MDLYLLNHNDHLIVCKYFNIHPLKGVKKTKEHISKIVAKTKGQKRSLEIKIKISNGKIGTKYSQQHKDAIGKSNKGKHKKPTWLLESLTGRKHTPEAKLKMSLAKKGKKKKENPISTEYEQIRKNDDGKKWVKAVYKRDHYKCQHCGQIGKNLNAHHIKPFKILLQEAKDMFNDLSLYDAAQKYEPLWDINNGITLCESCHKIEHKRLRENK